jgi:hypothetical protein
MKYNIADNKNTAQENFVNTSNSSQGWQRGSSQAQLNQNRSNQGYRQGISQTGHVGFRQPNYPESFSSKSP